MGYLTLTRKAGENVRLTVEPDVDTEKLLRCLMRDGITIHIGTMKTSGAVRVSIEAPPQVCILRDELLNS